MLKYGISHSGKYERDISRISSPRKVGINGLLRIRMHVTKSIQNEIPRCNTIALWSVILRKKVDQM